eukprot:CAMPEP_0206612086 /NCGR_PEP_ID=MMETSP0325_2-20121206/55739_1 /ASSEMBLY_ACC=CAM_ASM_000347 /TAXON_ID=2866 /ORGANISM="Crypthecodinium cohnii, Strain Seligo" /LENGTH=75 /DNA_ID=CAMNT_0054131629 /DNA_START=69 /DNA_END=296 /DNA_ORIENTATION=-
MPVSSMRKRLSSKSTPRCSSSIRKRSWDVAATSADGGGCDRTTGGGWDTTVERAHSSGLLLGMTGVLGASSKSPV